MKNSLTQKLASIPPESSRLKIAFGGRDLEITNKDNGDIH